MKPIFTMFLVMLCLLTQSLQAQPPTVETVDVIAENFQQSETEFLDTATVCFLEVIYGGIAPMTIHPRDTIDVNDTELGLYDSIGILVAANDDIDFGAGSLKSVL